MSENKRRIVFFVHIPKTAGTSLYEQLFRQYYCNDTIAKTRGMYSFLRINCRKTHFIGGHIPYGAHRFLPCRHYPLYVTMLRDPVDRVISYYYFVKFSKSKKYTHPDYPVISRLDLAQYCKLSKFRNTQTRQLAGYFANRFHKINMVGMGRSWMCTRAFHNITVKFSVFGLCEYFPQSVELIANVLGINNQKEKRYKRIKVTIGKPDMRSIQPEIIQLIREYNSEDVVLYRKARAFFLERCGEKGIALS